jgi:hypothetical protein
VGAQSAALLASADVLGQPQPFRTSVTRRIDAPQGWRLADVALSHGGVGLAPTAYDRHALSTVLPSGTRARVLPDLTVELSSAPTDGDLAVLRRVLDLDADLSGLWAAAPAWREQGWQLRAGSPFEAMAQALASTNASYRATQAMLRELVGDGPFPAPDRALARPLTRWGYRLPALLALAEQVEATNWHALPDDDLHAAVLALRGFGPFAAASVLPLLGRPRPLVLDGWLAAQVPDPSRYESYGRWGGTVLWLEVSSRWKGSGRTSER